MRLLLPTRTDEWFMMLIFSKMGRKESNGLRADASGKMGLAGALECRGKALMLLAKAGVHTAIYKKLQLENRRAEEQFLEG